MDWINSKELKPKDGQVVLVTNGKQVSIAKYYLYADNFCFNDKILKTTYWMQLPKPPKE
ncbi:hypothetical protein LCGC14_0503580 [marine sediment metagenome]|uniref:DUF551 domain-containing protein n=1 Tax=marine sediment metagenome TaxID=412755 RepID=A0A0F9S339_9ZZZZ